MLSVRGTGPECYSFIREEYQRRYGIVMPVTSAKTIDDVVELGLRMGWQVIDKPEPGALVIMLKFNELHFGIVEDASGAMTHASYGRVRKSSLQALDRSVIEYRLMIHEAIRARCAGV